MCFRVARADEAHVPDRAAPDQIARLRELCASDAIPPDVSEKVTAAIRKGLTAEKAADWIRRIEAKVAA